MFIADNTDYEDPTSGQTSGGQNGGSKPSAKPTTQQTKLTTKSVLKTTNKPTTAKTSDESTGTNGGSNPEVPIRWSKENRTTTDPTCDEFCQHRFQMCTFVGVNPPLYGCQTIGPHRFTPNDGGTKLFEGDSNSSTSNSTPSLGEKT